MSSNTKAVSTTSVSSDATAIDALCDMSRRRGLHAARTEVEQTWKTVAGKNFEEKLCAAWGWLFAGHDVEHVPLGLAHNAQMPAWIVYGDSFGIDRKSTRLNSSH